MDTAWIKLTRENGAENVSMFGAGGVIAFCREPGQRTTICTNASGSSFFVLEDPAYILEMLRKVRGTEVRLTEKPTKKKVKAKRGKKK